VRCGGGICIEISKGECNAGHGRYGGEWEKVRLDVYLVQVGEDARAIDRDEEDEGLFGT
jgi:hypothetical protein